MPQPLGRPARDDRSNVVSVGLTLRLSPNERALLDRIVAVRAEEVADAGGAALSVNSVVRSLILREAKALGLSLDPEEDAPAKTAKRAKRAKPARGR